MIENIYAIYDRKAGIALKPFLIHRNDVVPIRELTQLVNDETTILHKHAPDFTLIQLGTVNLETLHLEQENIRDVVTAAELLQKEP